MDIADVQDEITKVLLTKEQIQETIARAAARVDKDYANKTPLVIGVLKGAVNTMTAFTQALHINVEMDFMSLSSYGNGTSSTGNVRIRQDLSTDVKGRDVLIVEDIIDSGRTLMWLKEFLLHRGATSVEIFALLSKPARHEVEVDVKYGGFEIPDEFVIGFGLDYAEKYRNLDCIAVLDPKVYKGEVE